MSDVEGWVFAGLFLLAIYWLTLLWRLRSAIRQHDHRLYDDLHLDELFHRHNARATIAVFQFIYSSWPRELDNPLILTLCGRAKIVVPVFLVLFIWLFISIVQGASVKSGAVTKGEAEDVEKVVSPREQAFELHRQNQYAEAAKAYDDLLLTNYRDPELHYWRGQARWHLEEFDGAVRDFKIVLQEDPDHYDAAVKIDRILAPDRRWSEILSVWNTYIRNSPTDERAYFERSGTHYHNGDMDSAIRDLEASCRLGLEEACRTRKRFN